jgi:hypothetical protein
MNVDGIIIKTKHIKLLVTLNVGGGVAGWGFGVTM